MSRVFNVSFNESESPFLTEFRNFVHQKVMPLEPQKIEDRSFELDLYREFHKRNYLHPATPKKFGGREFSMVELAHMYRELGYGSASTAGTLVGNILGCTAVLVFGNEQLKNEVCQQYMSEFGLWSFAMTEADVGSDLHNTRTVAKEVADGFLINGEKNFITNSTHSRYITVFARHIDASGKDLGISAFFVPGNSTGLTRGPSLDKLAWRKADTGSLLFNNVLIPKNNLLAAPGRGLKVLGRCLNRSKTMLAASSVGLATRALDLATERMATTTRFDKPLIEQASIAQFIAQLRTKVAAAWALVLQASAAWDEDHDSTLYASMAKLFAGQVGVEVANEALELVGSRGLLNEFEVSRLYRDAKVAEIIEGPTFIQELIISRELAKEIQQNLPASFDKAAS